MKRLLAALIAALLPLAANAQSGTNVAPGNSYGYAVSQPFYISNTDAAGYSEQSEAAVTGAGSAQATPTTSPSVAATVLPTRVNVVTCAAGTGVQLPAIQRYTPITILNRGAAACLVYPSYGGYLETAAGTLAAVNATFSLAAGADVTFRPAIVNGQTEWLQ